MSHIKFILNFTRKFNKLFNSKTKISLCILVFYLIFLSILEFISLGSIPVLINFILEPQSINSILEIDMNFYFPNINKLYFVIFFILCLFLIKSFFLLYANYYELKTIKSLKIILTNKLFDLYLNKKYDFFIKNNQSILIRNLIQETNNCVGFIQSCVTCIKEFFLLVIIFILIFFYKPLLSSLILLFLIFFSLLFYLFTDKIIKDVASKRIRSLLYIYDLIPQVINLIKEIKILNKELFFSKRFFDIKKKFEDQIFIVDLIRRLPKIFFEFIAIIVFLILLILFDFNNKEEFVKSLPFLSLILISTIKLIPSFNSIAGSLTHFQSYLNSFNLIANSISDPKDSKIKRNFTFSNNKNIISIKNLNFKYTKKSKSLFLKNINMHIRKGEMIGIIGKSGSGKSTLVNLLLGLLGPTKGKITYFFHTKKYSVGLVPQDIVIFNDTLQNNIALGVKKEEIDKNKLYEVINLSGLYNFFKKNNLNLNMNLGNQGINISGGEKQRIGIARALYFNPSVIIFDEATSSLDQITEKKVMDELLNLKKKVTIIFVSHRLSALKNCDKIILLKNGIAKILRNSKKLKNLMNYI